MKTEPELRVLGLLSSKPFDSYRAVEISRSANLSIRWVYRVIKRLEAEELISFKGAKAKSNLQNPVCANYKKVFDLEYIFSLPEKEMILDILDKIKHSLKYELISMLLVGSATQPGEKYRDIDLLVITTDKASFSLRDLNLLGYPVEIIIKKEKDFKKEYYDCDDFIISALERGRIIYDNDFIIDFFSRSLPIPSKGIILERIKQVNEMKKEITYLSRQGNYPRLVGVLTSMVVGIIRVLLWKKSLIPRTRPELPNQISEIISLKEVDKKTADLLKDLKRDLLFLEEKSKQKIDKKSIIALRNLGDKYHGFNI